MALILAHLTPTPRGFAWNPCHANKRGLRSSLGLATPLADAAVVTPAPQRQIIEQPFRLLNDADYALALSEARRARCVTAWRIRYRRLKTLSNQIARLELRVHKLTARLERLELIPMGWYSMLLTDRTKKRNRARRLKAFVDKYA